MIDVDKARELQNIKERLAKVELLTPHPAYAELVQSLRDDIRTLVGMVDTLQEDAVAGTTPAPAPVPVPTNLEVKSFIEELIEHLQACVPQDLAADQPATQEPA